MSHTTLPTAGAGVAAAAPEPAAAIPLQVSASGTAQVIEIVDAKGPVLRFQSQTTADGTPGITGYTSTDVIDLSTGTGSGRNRFVGGDGDELFGSFTVQAVPGPEAGSLMLEGRTTFSGGTGRFAGATGSAGFTGSGRFVSDTQALLSLVHSGHVALMAAPGAMAATGAGRPLSAAAAQQPG
jgi:hypothetical protein